MPAAKKKPAIDIPQDDDAANVILRSYGENLLKLAAIETAMSAEVATLKASAETEATPFREECATMEKQLAAYGAAHRDRLTEKGKSKSFKLSAGECGWRSAPPSVTWTKKFKAEDILNNAKALIAKLAKRPSRKSADMLVLATRFVRTKEELNKEAMLDTPRLARLVEGVRIGSSGEKFYITPVGLELAEPKS